MFTQYFGQYLFNKGILSADQLCDLLAYEQSTHVKLGVLALNSGLMTAAQIEEVHELQRAMDRRFGEIALSKGYLTQPQLDNLLSQQTSRHLGLNQAILDRNCLTLSQLETALENFKQDTGLSQAQLQALQSADVDQIVPLFLDFPQDETGRLHYDYVALLLKNIVRFLNDQPLLSRPLPQSKQPEGWIISQQAVGDHTLSTALVLSDSSLIGLAARFSQEEITQVDDLAKDSVAEFLNLHNGIFLINMSDRGLELDLKPQTTQVCSGVSGCRIPITLTSGPIELVLSIT
ncbi:conserved hypothetical protein [uncultured Sporomusa sp.]|uniref:Bacteriophage N4 adsorption protein B n=1 Tax=uncultured Sporomusa sp. TaxID=307249 RepID=A0A212LN65_9FIRM|nr:hypothetical protein [uncultured Sporomusa sp.]SCM78982.1 conserved hypothetical protein [uncultured Sporomusa sp.]